MLNLPLLKMDTRYDDYLTIWLLNPGKLFDVAFQISITTRDVVCYAWINGQIFRLDTSYNNGPKGLYPLATSEPMYEQENQLALVGE